MKWLTGVLVLILVWMQYSLWFADGGWRDLKRYEYEVKQQQTINNKLLNRNTTLEAEVRDLQSGQDAIAEIARVDLGYIQNGEIYYRFVYTDEP